MKKIIKALILTLAIAALIKQPQKALAATEVNDWTGVKSALESASTDEVILTGDIVAEAQITVSTSKTLDLNGHSLRNTNTALEINLIVVSGSGVTFTLNDTLGGGMLSNECTAASGNISVVLVKEDAKFVMNGGKIAGSNSSFVETGVDLDGYASFEMNGGEISRCSPGVSVSVDTASFAFSGGTIKNCKASNGGGVLCYGSMNMTGGTIESCVADSTSAYVGGGGINCAGSLTMTGGTIKSCSAICPNGESGGGGIFLRDGAVANISGVTIVSCIAIKYGGAIFSRNSGAMNNIVISGCQISNCIAQYGGGIAAELTGATGGLVNKITFSGSTISNCSAADAGGGVWLSAYQQFVMTSGSITDCNAPAGGGIYSNCHVNEQTTIKITGGTISGCSATTTDGGAVYLYRASLILDGGNISGCTSESKGGGVFVGDVQSSLTIGSGTISNCSSAKGGGVFYDEGTVTMNGGMITSCSASLAGGGIHYGTNTNNTNGLHINGNATVTGNTCASVANNIYIPSSAAIEVGRRIQVDGNLTGTIGVNMDGYSSEDHMGFTGTMFVNMNGATGANRFSFDSSPSMTVEVDEAGNVTWKALDYVPTPEPTPEQAPSGNEYYIPAGLVFSSDLFKNNSDKKESEEDTRNSRDDEINKLCSQARQELGEVFTSTNCYAASVSNSIDDAIIATYKNGAYRDESGNIVKNAFVKTEKGIIFVAEDGRKLKKTLVCAINPESMVQTTYYINRKGYAVTNKVVTLEDKTRIFLSQDGSLATDSIVQAPSTGRRYYADNSGVIVKNSVIKVGSRKYFTNSYGVIRTNAIVTDAAGKQHYCGEDGAFATSEWVTVGDYRYWCTKYGNINKKKEVTD